MVAADAGPATGASHTTKAAVNAPINLLCISVSPNVNKFHDRTRGFSDPAQLSKAVRHAVRLLCYRPEPGGTLAVHRRDRMNLPRARHNRYGNCRRSVPQQLP